MVPVNPFLMQAVMQGLGDMGQNRVGGSTLYTLPLCPQQRPLF